MVSTTRERRVAGYYCLSASSLERVDGTPEFTKGMPRSIPVVLLGRLAVDEEFQRQGLGYSLLQDATARALEAARTIGIHAMLVHAIGDEAAGFYTRFGFTPFPAEQRTLYLLTKDARSTLAPARDPH